MATYKLLKAKKEAAMKLLQNPNVKTKIRSQMASAAPPLGPMLGQRGVNVAAFCKDFNATTSNIKHGAILPVNIYIKPDRTYDLDIGTPTTAWLLKQAAGIRRGKQRKDEIIGRLSVKHIYEIAKVKAVDKIMVGVPLNEICQMIIDRANLMGIKVLNEDLDATKYQEFLDERREIVKEQLDRKAKAEAAKLLRQT